MYAPAVADDRLYVGTYARDTNSAVMVALGPGPEDGLARSAVVSGGDSGAAPAEPGHVTVPDCTPFASYDEAQAYYAGHPEAQPVIDPDVDGLACEVYFFGGDPAPASAPSNGGGTSGGGGGGGDGGGPINTDFGGLDGIDYDCYDVASPADAQAYFNADGGSAANNADGLDRNHNGLACEPGEFD